MIISKPASLLTNWRKREKLRRAHEYQCFMRVLVGYSSPDFRSSFKLGGFKAGLDGKGDVLERIAPAPELGEAELFIVTAKDLGLKKGGTQTQIYRKAKRLGFGKCWPEIGVKARINYPNQPRGETLLVAMDPFKDSDDCLDILALTSVKSGLWLETEDGRPDRHWPAESKWLFRRK
jgi:hypothetical protein